MRDDFFTPVTKSSSFKSIWGNSQYKLRKHCADTGVSTIPTLVACGNRFLRLTSEVF